MTDIVGGLRDLAALKHDDFSIGNEAADEIESLRERLHKVSLDWQDMRQQLNAALAVLRQVEYSDNSGEYIPCCPVCGVMIREQHLPKCELSALLAADKEQK
jgi:hypothetical protein